MGPMDWRERTERKNKRARECGGERSTRTTKEKGRRRLRSRMFVRMMEEAKSVAAAERPNGMRGRT